MPSLLARIRLEAADAKADPSLLPQFKALRLNLGVHDTEIQLLIAAETWARIEGIAEQSGDYCLGIDLGTTSSMSAAAAYFPDSGLLDTFACFGAIPGLAERGLSDGAGRAYIDMYNRRELILSEGRVSNIEDLLNEVLTRWGPPAAVACDTWREGELRDALDKMRFPKCALIVRRMGYLDGSEDVRSFRRACLSGAVTPAASLLLRTAMSEARCAMDVAGNCKLAKKTEGQRRLKARDDAAAAGVLAVAVGFRHQSKRPQRSVYLGRA